MLGINTVSAKLSKSGNRQKSKLNPIPKKKDVRPTGLILLRKELLLDYYAARDCTTQCLRDGA